MLAVQRSLRLVIVHLSLVACVIAVASAVCGAQMRNMAVEDEAPLKNVHTVAVFINMGPTLPAPYVPNFDRAKKQISQKLEKAKLKLVADPKDADVVLVATEYDVDTGAVTTIHMIGDTGTGTANTTNRVCLGDELKAYQGGKQPTQEDSPIWSANDACGFSWPLNRVMDKFLKALKK